MRDFKKIKQIKQELYLSLLRNGFVSKLLATPFLVDLSKAVIEVLLDSRLQLGKLVEIFLVDVHDG